MNRKKQTANPISVIILILIVGGSIFYSATYGQSSPCSPSLVNHETSVLPVWKLQGMRIEGDYDDAQMSVVAGKLIYYDDNRKSVVAVNSMNGQLNWYINTSMFMTMTSSDELLFAGGSGRINGINPDSGKVEWATKLPANVTKLLVRDNILYADSTNKYYLLEAETGNVIRSMDYTVDENWNPDLPLWSNHLMGLEFVNHISFFQRQIDWPMVTGIEIVATDNVSNRQLWSSELTIVGRAAISPIGILVLDAEGTLLMLEVETGTIHEIVKFSPAPSKIYECPDGGWISYGFSVAIDTDSHMVFVYLGDGEELFAFKSPI